MERAVLLNNRFNRSHSVGVGLGELSAGLLIHPLISLTLVVVQFKILLCKDLSFCFYNLKINLRQVAL